MKTFVAIVAFALGGTLLAQDHPGLAVYKKYCDQCHGTLGDGRGYAEPYVWPKPRDFTSAVFKFRSTASGYLPLEEDLIRAVKDGLPGTSMPSFAQIGDPQIKDVVAYIQTFYTDRQERDKAEGFWPPKQVEWKNAPKITADLVSKGEELYFANGCGDCHGYEGKADGPSAPTLKNDDGTPTRPANLTSKWRFRGGGTVNDIYRAFSTGVSGTPMPSFGDSLKDEDRWALAAFVHSLSPDQEPNASAQVIAANVSGPLPTEIDDPRWQNTSLAYFPLSAQIIWDPVSIDPTIHGVSVRALHNGQSLALLLEWQDPSFSLSAASGEGENGQEEPAEEDDFFAEEDDPFGEEAAATVLDDAFSVQFPAGLAKTNERPYIVMGDGSNAVNMWRWTNSPDAQKIAVAADADRSTQKYWTEYTAAPVIADQNAKGRDRVEASTAGAPITAKLHYRNGAYRLMLVRDLVSDNSQAIQMKPGDFIPIAFWGWDGGNEEEGAKAALSAWYWLVLEQPVDSSVYFKSAAVILAVVLFQFWAVSSARRKAREADEGGASAASPTTAGELV